MGHNTMGTKTETENENGLGPEGTQTYSNLERDEGGRRPPGSSVKKNPVGVGERYSVTGPESWRAPVGKGMLPS